MTPERYARICELFDQAAPLPAGERDTFLRAACGDDSTLLAEVKKMLAADASTASQALVVGRIANPSHAAWLPEPDVTADLVGRRIGPYQLQRLLGSGGMGSVYLAARVDDFQQQVAIKLIKAGLGTEELIHRFRTERQVLAGLNHPHIARLFDGGTTADGLPYFVMEYIEGQPIDRYCEARQLPARERAQLVYLICQAVHHAHQHTIVHRDLKPGNVLMTPEGTPKVVDFGLAKRLGSEQERGMSDAAHTQSGAILGTPSYMAPEQAGGKPQDIGPAADVYALGAILYQLLTGRPPFRADTPLDTILQVLQEEPVPPGRLHPKLSPDLETICLKCLQKDPQRRYAGADALADDLGRFLRGEPIHARPVGQVERLWRWCRRYPLVASLTGLVALLLLAGTVGATLSALGFRRAAEQEQQINNKLERALYTQSIAVAERELSLRQDIARAEQLLEGCPSHLRGWEWYHLQRLLDGPVPVLRGHSKGVWSVAFCPTSHRLASASIDGTIKIWDGDTGEEIRTLHLGPTTRLPHPVMGVAFSPEGKRVVAAGLVPNFLDLFNPSGIVKIWDVETGKLLQTYEGHKELVVGIAFSPDGRRVASAGFGKEVHLWDAVTGKTEHILKGHTDWINRLAFDADGKLLASPSMDGTVKLWDTVSGREVRSLTGHTGPVRDVEFSRDGRTLVTAGMDGTIKFWHPETGLELTTLVGHSGPVQAVSFSPDGRRLASGGFDKTVKVWDLETGTPAITLRGHTDSIWSVAFSSDGYLLASACFDNTVRVWDATPRSVKPSPPASTPLGHTDAVNVVAVSPDGKRLASGSWDKTVRLWDLERNQELFTLSGHEGAVFGLAFSHDGRRLASACWDRTIKLWDCANGKELRTLAGHSTLVHCVSFHPDGKRLASGCIDGSVKIWNADTGAELRTLRGHLNLVYAVAFSPDGKLLASGAGDRAIKLWDVDTGDEINGFEHDAVVYGLSFSPDGKTLASASWDQTVKLWEIASGKELKKFRGHTDRIHAVCFSPDGRFLASSSEDKTVRLWDVQTGKELGKPRVHRGVVWGLCWHPDAKRLASACWYARGGITIWDAFLTQRP